MNACRFSTIFAAALLSASLSAQAQTFEVGFGAGASPRVSSGGSAAEKEMSMPTTTNTLPAQLQALESELSVAREQVHRLTRGLSDEAWRLRPAPERWSIGEQIVHLNLTSRAFLPRLDEAVRSARDEGRTGEGPYRRDFLGWLLGRMMEPPVRLRVKTTAPFVPSALEPIETALRAFDRLQDELAALLGRAASLALDRVEIVSPFDGRVRYNAWSALRILTAHQRRHLWLAERVRTELAS